MFGLTKGPPLHDPIAVAVLLDNIIEGNLFDDRGGERWQVKVVTDGMHSNREVEQGQVGRTVVTPSEEESVYGPGVRIPRGLDVDRFWAILEECIQRAEEVVSSPHTVDAEPVSP